MIDDLIGELRNAIKFSHKKVVDEILSKNELSENLLSDAMKYVIEIDANSFTANSALANVLNRRAMPRDRLGIIKALLKKGADINTERNGDTVLNRLVERNDLRNVNYFLKHYSDNLSIETVEYAFGSACNTTTVKDTNLFNAFVAFCKRRFNYDFSDTPVFFDALLFVNEEAMDALLTEGYDINRRNDGGKTDAMRLFESISGDGDDIISDGIRYLLSKGADLLIKDNNGKTVMDYANEAEDENPISKSLLQLVIDEDTLNKTITSKQEGNQFLF